MWLASRWVPSRQVQNSLNVIPDSRIWENGPERFQGRISLESCVMSHFSRLFETHGRITSDPQAKLNTLSSSRACYVGSIPSASVVGGTPRFTQLLSQVLYCHDRGAASPAYAARRIDGNIILRGESLIRVLDFGIMVLDCLAAPFNALSWFLHALHMLKQSECEISARRKRVLRDWGKMR